MAARRRRIRNSIAISSSARIRELRAIKLSAVVRARPRPYTSRQSNECPLRKRLLILAAIAGLVALALPTLSADQSARPAPPAQARVLSAAQKAILAKARQLGPPDPGFKLAKGVRGVQVGAAPLTLNPKKEIVCGVFIYPPSPNPYVLSYALYYVNTTGKAFPPGVHVEFQLEGWSMTKVPCCKGVTGATTKVWPPGPPVYFYSAEEELTPPQPAYTKCKAWAIMP